MEYQFGIDYWWEKRQAPDEFGSTREPVREALHAFLTWHHGGFSLTVAWEEVPFSLRPDLTSIFDDLPNVLKTLKYREKVPVELDFFEQGTEVGVWMHRKGEEIFIRFETCPGSGEQYQTLSDKEFPVSAKQFFGQWQAFLGALLVAMAKAHPQAEEDPSYVQYKDAIHSLTANE